MTIGPLAHVPVDPSIAALPKADLHLHQDEPEEAADDEEREWRDH